MPANSREVIEAPAAPAAVGPYSHAIKTDGLLFCSGQLALDPASGELLGATAAEQATQCLLNLESVCAAADTELSRAVKVTLYLTDMANFAAVNEVYAGFFPVDPPARVGLAVAALPKDALVEIDAIVAL